MDQELQSYLKGQFAATQAFFEGQFAATQAFFEGQFAATRASSDAQFAAMDAKIAAAVQLIEDTSASLQREVGTVRDTMEDIRRRLDRQAGLIQTGARQTTRFVSWSEKVDIALEGLKQRVQSLESRDQQR